MNKILLNQITLFIFFLLCFLGHTYAQEISLSSQEIRWIGDRIFENECASKDEMLVQWDEGEDFLSLGIGHFIWYHQGKRGPFEEDFPDFLVFAKKSGAQIPGWLNTDPVLFCPWTSRDDFLQNQNDSRLLELRKFLIASKAYQIAFIVKRFNDTIPLVLKHMTSKNLKIIKRQLERLSSSPSGIYALVDYSNFKGMGNLPSEQYHGQGWGLLQVLFEMRNEKESPDALEEFVKTAKRIITRRVANSPKERNEQRWLPGWQNRIDSYLIKIK